MDVPLYADIQKSFKIVQLHTPHLPSKIQISFGLSGKCSANRAGLKSDEINCCFLGEVVVLGLVALLFYFFFFEGFIGRELGRISNLPQDFPPISLFAES